MNIFRVEIRGILLFSACYPLFSCNVKKWKALGIRRRFGTSSWSRRVLGSTVFGPPVGPKILRVAGWVPSAGQSLCFSPKLFLGRFHSRFTASTNCWQWLESICVFHRYWGILMPLPDRFERAGRRCRVYFTISADPHKFLRSDD